MPISKKRFENIKKIPLQVIGVFVVLFAALLLLWRSAVNSNEAISALVAKVYFEGEYRIGDEDWKQIVVGQHIPATKGDVTLKGKFHMLAPDGEYVGPLEADVPIAFYMDHINVTIYEEGQEPYVKDNENPLLGFSTCGKSWDVHTFAGDGTKSIEMVVHNPHRFGNETAVDELIAKFSIWSGMDFEKEVLSKGEKQRNLGLCFVVISFVLVGTALFMVLIRMKKSDGVGVIGLTVLSAGTYFIYSSEGISFWSDSGVFGTLLLVLSVMLYSLFLTMSISYFLKETKRIGTIVTTVLAVIDVAFLLLPLLSDFYFYDTLSLWVVVQTGANILLVGCLVKEFLSAKKRKRWFYLTMLLPLAFFELDAIMTWLGSWQGGLISRYIFAILFVGVTMMALKAIPRSFREAEKAKRLEAEKLALNAQLAESRISTMMSQIRPHFIYNTLGSIEQLCEIDPPKAGELVHNFAKYLRGNFRELDNPKPIRMSQEMEHVRHYINIENVRFPDMTITFELLAGDFSLPALTVQPIVENAIKHGLMKLQKGGNIRIASYETDTHYCVSVEDDGVGFDASILGDEREHVGLRNIRGRLETMVGGTLEIESAQGVGTKVLIKIPKEIQE